MYLKHMLGALCLVCVLAMPAGAAAPRMDLTGQQWDQSSAAEKLSFLYGASSVVAIEKAVAEKSGEKPTVFVSRWMTAFQGKTMSQIKQELDAWYAAHPAEKNRHVFDVIWYELIAPRSGK